MNETLEIKYGMLVLSRLLSSVWLGQWNQFEKILSEMPADLREKLPFTSQYHHEEVDILYQNHFFIPGNYFVSPYLSTYLSQKNEDSEETNKELLCLIGIYEKMGFYFPLEQQLYPDHIGCLNVFLESVVNEEINAYKNKETDYLNQLSELRKEMVVQYLLPLQNGVQKAAKEKIHHPFWQQFLNFYSEFLEKDAGTLI